MRNEIFIPSDEASTGIHEGGIVILHVGQGLLYQSNGTGASIWRAVGRRLSLEAIVDQVSSEFQISRSAAREDTVHFLTELERHELVHRRTAA